MLCDDLVDRINTYLGFEPTDVDQDGMSATLSYATPSGRPLFTISLFSGDGATWQIGGWGELLKGCDAVLRTMHELGWERSRIRGWKAQETTTE